MNNCNLSSISTNLNSYKVPFRGSDDNLVSNPKVELAQQRELASKECAYATRATAMAQLSMVNDVKPNMTYLEYTDKLMKQGKNPSKDFKVTTTDESYIVEELNQKGQVTKEIIFADEKHNNDIIVKLRNPSNQKVYKVSEYSSDGSLVVAYNNPITGGPLLDEAYNVDGSLKNYAMYRKCNNSETSINGDYVITGVELPQQ